MSQFRSYRNDQNNQHTGRLKKDLSAYAGAKGSVQFPIDKPIPFELISKIVKFRVKESIEKAGKKSNDTLSISCAAGRISYSFIGA
jgi:hypothetical protein